MPQPYQHHIIVFKRRSRFHHPEMQLVSRDAIMMLTRVLLFFRVRTLALSCTATSYIDVSGAFSFLPKIGPKLFSAEPVR